MEEFIVRGLQLQDKEEIINIICKAFADLERKYGIPEGLSIERLTRGVVNAIMDSGVVAVSNNRIIGVNFITNPDEDALKEDQLDIREIGPIATLTDHQAKGVGRKLM